MVSNAAPTFFSKPETLQHIMGFLRSKKEQISMQSIIYSVPPIYPYRIVIQYILLYVLFVCSLVFCKWYCDFSAGKIFLQILTTVGGHVDNSASGCVKVSCTHFIFILHLNLTLILWYSIEIVHNWLHKGNIVLSDGICPVVMLYLRKDHHSCAKTSLLYSV